jgi:hypothetical protein
MDVKAIVDVFVVLCMFGGLIYFLLFLRSVWCSVYERCVGSLRDAEEAIMISKEEVCCTLLKCA